MKKETIDLTGENLMKNFLIGIFLLGALMTQLLAGTADLQSLKSNMKQTDTLLKKIVSTISDSSKNQENAASVGNMIKLFQTARSQTPDSLKNGSLEDYQNLIDQEIQNFTDLQAAFANNDNTLALSIAQKITVIKKEGHDKYK